MIWRKAETVWESENLRTPTALWGSPASKSNPWPICSLNAREGLLWVTQPSSCSLPPTPLKILHHGLIPLGMWHLLTQWFNQIYHFINYCKCLYRSSWTSRYNQVKRFVWISNSEEEEIHVTRVIFISHLAPEYL